MAIPLSSCSSIFARKLSITSSVRKHAFLTTHFSRFPKEEASKPICCIPTKNPSTEYSRRHDFPIASFISKAVDSGTQRVESVIAVILIFIQISSPIPLFGWDMLYTSAANAAISSPAIKLPGTAELALERNTNMKATEIALDVKEVILASADQEKGSILYATLPEAKATETSKKPTTSSSKFPRTLDGVVKTVVERPRQSRSKEEKQNEEEILVIYGIELDKDSFVKFGVYVNEEEVASSGPENTEFAGTFVNLPHNHGKQKKNNVVTCLKLGITDLLEDLGAEGDESVVVTLVPEYGSKPISIGGVKIEFDS